MKNGAHQVQALYENRRKKLSKPPETMKYFLVYKIVSENFLIIKKIIKIEIILKKINNLLFVLQFDLFICR